MPAKHSMSSRSGSLHTAHPNGCQDVQRLQIEEGVVAWQYEEVAGAGAIWHRGDYVADGLQDVEVFVATGEERFHEGGGDDEGFLGEECGVTVMSPASADGVDVDPFALVRELEFVEFGGLVRGEVKEVFGC
ncbi:MAG: hypothetical protein Q9225_003555 [Loekoesia sp. 1 TL-2023]